MSQKRFVFSLCFVFLLCFGTLGCTPQTIEPEEETTLVLPTTIPALATVSDELPTPVIEEATHTATPTETPAPPPTETTQPTDTAVPTKTAAATETATPASTETEPAPEDGDAEEDEVSALPRYAVVGVESDDTLNVRSGPGVDNDIVGELPNTGIGVTLTGEEEEVGQSSWVEIRYGNTTGWVNQTFLAEQYGEVNGAAESASEVILALKGREFETLAAYVHPEKGVRFSPYTFVEESDIVLSQAEVGQLEGDNTIYDWGIYDGEGGPIELTFADYYDRFIFDVDFSRPRSIGFDQFIGDGSMINNLEAFYPEAAFVEYHFPGFDPDFDGLDWRSLRLVMEEVEGEWLLVGVVHSEWTT